ncbi:MAG: tetratricopeptide repeat protein [Verrucomicrobiales bacterium]|nr:tetratricopeptide repeat protein [Verrucomicrobiales bacterium]
MSRFSNLEFPGGPEKTSSPSRSAPMGEDLLLGEARRAVERGDFEPALRRFARVLEENPRNRDAWIGQLLMMVVMEEFGEAAAWSDRALEVFPRDAEVLAMKARALVMSGRLEEALALSDASFEVGPPTAAVWLARGEVLLERGDRQGDECFAAAESLGSEDWLVAWQMARIRMRHGLFARAMKGLQGAMRRDAGLAVLWVQRGECELALGLRDAAEISFRRALEVHPDCRAAREGLGQSAQVGVWGRAAGLWRRLQGR